MSSIPHTAATALALFGPPYEQLTPCGPETIAELGDVDAWKGRAVVWVLSDRTNQMTHFEALRSKPRGLPLIVLLPPPAEIRSVIDMLPLVRHLSPRMVLPHGLVDTPYRLRQILSAPPRAISSTLTDYMVRRGMLRRRKPCASSSGLSNWLPKLAASPRCRVACTRRAAHLGVISLPRGCQYRPIACTSRGCFT